MGGTITRRVRRPAAEPGDIRVHSLLAALTALAALTVPALSAAQTQTQTQPAPKAAQTHTPGPQPSDDEDEGDEPAGPAIKVIGHRPPPPPPQPGAVVGDIKPEIQLSPADVQSYGVSTVTELLEELSPETRSDRGRGASTPVVLLNGRRISSFNEIQNIPTEAILRVDILPEEVSLKYGYTADQRVVNIVLRRRFRAITGELVGGGPTEGGDATGQAEVDQFRVLHDNRLNLDLKYTGAAGLADADRDLNGNPSGAPYDLIGNVTSATPGGEIDPALSALVGRPITIAGVPASALGGGKPSLADFVPTAGIANTTNTAADRSLAPATQTLTGNAVLARPIFWGINATVNATLSGNTSTSLQGLPGVGLSVPADDPFSPFASKVLLDRYAAGQGPSVQTVQGWTAHLGSALNRDMGDWRLSLTDAYDHADNLTVTDGGLNIAPLQALLNAASTSFDPFAALPSGLGRLAESTARSISDSGNIQVLANGPLLKIPAGDLYVSFKLGDTESAQASASQRASGFQAVNLSRNDSVAQLNVDLPLASKTHHVFGALGELSVNVNTAIDDLSDFGPLATLGYGVNWTPIPGYNLIVSETHDHAAPTIQQLGGPLIQTPGTRIFDYQTGQTVDVTQISGGDRQLVADSRQVMKVGLTLKPFPNDNFTFTANYIKSRIDNPIATFPAASAAIEAAFPDRFIRNADGELIEEDDRPVNFARQDHEEIRWGINYSRPVGKQPPPPSAEWRAAFARRRAAAAARAGTQPADGSAAPGAGGQTSSPDGPGGPGGPPDGDARARGGGGGGHGGGGGRGGGGFGAASAGRFQIAVYHTVILKDQVLVRPGGPVLDLLNGAAASNTGGQYQHEIEAQLGYTLNGYGLRLSADWRSATEVRGGTTTTGDLNFSDLGTINLRLWDNFAQQRAVVARFPILKGTRITLNIKNLFDQRISVRDSAGATPLIYQSDYLDPVGRTVSLSLRKVFY